MSKPSFMLFSASDTVSGQLLNVAVEPSSNAELTAVIVSSMYFFTLC